MKITIDIPDKIIARIRSNYGHGFRILEDYDKDIVVDEIYRATTPKNKRGRKLKKIHIPYYSCSGFCDKCSYTNICKDYDVEPISEVNMGDLTEREKTFLKHLLKIGEVSINNSSEYRLVSGNDARNFCYYELIEMAEKLGINLKED